ncbi:hypothetical protein ACFFX1_44715 [Dactylosporangium sucinum]|uniref:hypothetical protein n=1 Tax=Dactylosporangium sucinum TaxID=1424081 RepID=UPI0035E54390
MSTQPPDPTSTGGFAPQPGATPYAAQPQAQPAQPAQAQPAYAQAQPAQAQPAYAHVQPAQAQQAYGHAQPGQQPTSAQPAYGQAQPGQPQVQPQPTMTAAGEPKPARQFTAPYRELAALVLLGVGALFLLVGLIRLLTSFTQDFLLNAGGSFGTFVSLETVALPIIAVLLATHIEPAVSRARVVVLGALIEYAVSALFGVVLILASLIGDLQTDGVSFGFVLASFLGRLGMMGLLGLALFLVIRIYLGAYAPAKPVQYAYPYGQPGYPYGQQTGAFQQPGYAAAQTTVVPQAYQPQPGQAGYPQQQTATGGWANPATAYPAQQAQPTSTGAPAFSAPISGVPAPAQPTSTGAPAYTAPAATAPSFGAPPAPAPQAGAEPSSAPPLSSPFASYTAPATSADEPVSASPADTAPSTPPHGFAAAGWPGGTSTHPAPAEAAEGEAASPFGKTGAFPETGPKAGEPTAAVAATEAGPDAAAAFNPQPAAGPDATAAFSPQAAQPAADPDATAAFNPQPEAGPDATAAFSPQAAQPAADPDATAAFNPQQAQPAADPDATAKFEAPAQAAPRPAEDGDDTQRTQVIPPRD